MKTQERPQRKDVLYLPIEQINIEPDFNVRQDMGDLSALAKSIEENGIKNTIRGFKRDGVYWITDGHRRYYAAKILVKKGIDVKIPLISEGHLVTEEQRVIDMLVCNDGKKLNPIEESEAVARLFNYGYSETDINKKTGFSKVYICNLKLLNSAPRKLKDLIIQNIVSATLAMSILRECKDYSEALELIEAAIKGKSISVPKTKKTKQLAIETELEPEEEGEEEEETPVRITAKDIQKTKGEHNSFSCLEKAFKKIDKDKLPIRNDKLALVNYLREIVKGSYSLEDFILDLTN